MTQPPCPYPLVIHTGFGITECPDPKCTAAEADHTTRLPCRWAWPYAHGRSQGSHPFPGGQCPGCYHVRRAVKSDGQPAQALSEIRPIQTNPARSAAAAGR
jgi:hypothetical protein